MIFGFLLIVIFLGGCTVNKIVVPPPIPAPAPITTSKDCLGSPLAAALDCSCYKDNQVIPCQN